MVEYIVTGPEGDRTHQCRQDALSDAIKGDTIRKYINGQCHAVWTI